ncbi:MULTISPECIES: toll/interleukin-1 receptor domain-containing protein [unclassified Endozoicomonas]|uniref:toll/interleukin-1 receptor domain-containing protein n=1 Tax=unclassified Endozoicomonas TaxID=2644528 RepID=UPI003BB59373
MVENPKVFISYSHDNEEHKEWVCRLATELMGKGIETLLDQWDLELGANLPKFMEHGLTDSDRVLVICTDPYIDKSNEGVGGVGYENNILTASLLMNQQTTKFIPVVRNVTKAMKTPICLASRMYIDFSDDNEFENSLNQLIHEVYGLKIKPKPKLGENPFKKKDPRPTLNESSTSFFSMRFSSAFPGVRGVEWFDGENAAKRLEILLKEPLDFSNATPIWWWGYGDLHIKKFKVISDNFVRMDIDELKIKKIAAVNKGSYYQSFVYVEAEAMEPTGLYNTEHLEDSREQLGYCSEEFAIFKDRLISRADYDDGATVIDNVPVELNGEAELRCRYITPYNFIIAPQASPINNHHFDRQRRVYLKAIMQDSSQIDDLADIVIKLPKNRD